MFVYNLPPEIRTPHLYVLYLFRVLRFLDQNRTEIDTDNAVYTGKGDISRVGQYVKWNGHTEIFEHGGWGTETAKMINGTGGFLFAPDVKRHHNLTAFISELYRYMYIHVLYIVICYS